MPNGAATIILADCSCPPDQTLRRPRPPSFLPRGEAILPGADGILPRAGAILPGETCVLPGDAPILPREDRILPGVKPILPRGNPILPRENPILPGENSSLPGEKNILPGEKSILPGENSSPRGEGFRCNPLKISRLRGKTLRTGEIAHYRGTDRSSQAYFTAKYNAQGAQNRQNCRPSTPPAQKPTPTMPGTRQKPTLLSPMRMSTNTQICFPFSSSA